MITTKRSKPLFDRNTPAITPIFSSPTIDITAALRTQIADLKKTLYAERRRHGQLERALAKYQQILEATITSQREAFVTLGKELKPEQSRRKQ